MLELAYIVSPRSPPAFAPRTLSEGAKCRIGVLPVALTERVNRGEGRTKAFPKTFQKTSRSANLSGVTLSRSIFPAAGMAKPPAAETPPSPRFRLDSPPHASLRFLSIARDNRVVRHPGARGFDSRHPHPIAEHFASARIWLIPKLQPFNVLSRGPPMCEPRLFLFAESSTNSQLQRADHVHDHHR